jgi:uncharacterized protein (TIGR02118 family)
VPQKFEFLLRRRPGLTREAFQKTWLEDHGPLVAERAGALGCVRYVQVHTDLDAVARPGRPEPFDGVAELWFSEDARTGTPEDRRRAAAELLEDERRFIDLEASPLWIGEERTVLDRGIGPGLHRLTYPLRRVQGMSDDEFYGYWWETHGPLIAGFAVPRLRRYQQIHTNRDAAAFGGRLSRNAPPPYDGIAILWYDDSLPGRTPEEAARVSPIIQADEAKFIEHSQSPLWYGTEHVIVGTHT